MVQSDVKSFGCQARTQKLQRDTSALDHLPTMPPQRQFGAKLSENAHRRPKLYSNTEKPYVYCSVGRFTMSLSWPLHAGVAQKTLATKTFDIRLYTCAMLETLKLWRVALTAQFSLASGTAAWGHALPRLGLHTRLHPQAENTAKGGILSSQNFNAPHGPAGA
jgi:hypothetical protein